MKNAAASLLLLGCLSLCSCDYLASYSMEVRQGNIIESPEVAQIKKGMSKEQVARIMGTPVLENIFDNDRWSYVYTHKKGRRPLVYDQFIVVFQQNRVIYTEDRGRIAGW